MPAPAPSTISAITGAPTNPNPSYPPALPTSLPKSWLGASAQLTGIQRTGVHKKTPALTAEKPKAVTEVSPNPASVLKTGYPVSKPDDAPPPTNKPPVPGPHSLPQINTQTDRGSKEDERSVNLGGLSSVAAAASSAMQIDTDSPAVPTSASTDTSATGEGSMTPGPGTALQTPLSGHPGMDPISAMTPTTPYALSATTPTTPFSPMTPGGSRSKHMCPHCNQTFTRHHNLKSHLLTHSHEKPFPCSQCTARFRRLHDLKRHQKLHTGERPHMCEKCGRKFARGDALARHARGEGGCAGRRSSIGGLLDGDEIMSTGDGAEGDDVLKRIMDNPMGSSDDGDIMMTDQDPETPSIEKAPGSATPDTMSSTPAGSGSTPSGARRPASLPSIKTNVADKPVNAHLHAHNHHPYGGSYPPMTPARSAASATSQHSSGLFATPGARSTASRRGTSPISMSAIPQSITQSTMTESPGPLSPNNNPLDRSKSPYHLAPKSASQPHHYQIPLTPQSAQGTGPAIPTQFGRAPQSSMAATVNGNPASTTNNTSSSSFSYPQHNNNQQRPPSAPRFSASEANKASSGSSGGDNPNIFENEGGIWAYTKELERRVAELEEKVKGFDAVLAGLIAGGQVSAQQVQQAQRDVAAAAAAAAAGTGTTTATATATTEAQTTSS